MEAASGPGIDAKKHLPCSAKCVPKGVERGVELAALQQAKEVRKSNNRSRCCRFASQSLEVRGGGEREGRERKRRKGQEEDKEEEDEPRRPDMSRRKQAKPRSVKDTRPDGGHGCGLLLLQRLSLGARREELDQHDPFQPWWCTAVSVRAQYGCQPPPKLLHIAELPLPGARQPEV
ncbi:unnamed protein product [Coccothraustes coccothraustes]